MDAIALRECRDAQDESPTRVLLVEDHAAVARGLELLLRRDGFEVVGIAPDLERARGLLARRGANVAVVDLNLGEESGLDLLQPALAAGTRVLVYTADADAEAVARVRAAGALGLASKGGSLADLLTGVQTVARGEPYLDSRLAPAALPLPAPGPALTAREGEIVGLLAVGLSGEEIAGRLCLSPDTVRTHIRNAMGRLGARTRAHLIAVAGSRRTSHVVSV